MPSDLSGTPTSLGIGTYNTSEDAPSGLGFNEAMAQIDALIASRVLKPAGIVANEGVVWNGSAWARGPAITVTADTTPPASAKTGDIWIAQNFGPNGESWHFVYLSGQTFPWMYVGGTELRAASDSLTTVSSASFADWGTPLTLTLPRAGDYVVGASYRYITPSGATSHGTSLQVGGAEVYLSDNGGTAGFFHIHGEDSFTGVSANAVFKSRGYVTTGTLTATGRRIWARPIRVA